MNNENNMLMNEEVVETGMEIATEVVKNNDLMKKIGTGAGFAVAGVIAYEGGKKLVGFIKSKIKAAKEKKENDKSEASEKKAENIED